MTEWSNITPPSPVREVEQQRKRVLALRGQIPKRRAERDTAAARVVEVEAADRRRMAEQMTRGEAPVSDIGQIEKARAEAAGAVRASEALALAVESAEQELHQLALKHRVRWAERASQEVTKARTEAVAALAAFRTALVRYRDTQQVEHWLREGAGGLDRERPARSGVLGGATGSERVSGNAAPVALELVFSWLEQSLAPYEAPAQVEPQVSQPVRA